MNSALPKLGSLFRQSWSVFWATTYVFEPQLFEEFLLRRLGDAPINATILADPIRLAGTWAGIPASEAWRLRRANSDYLVRGWTAAHSPAAAGAFHPKAYLFANGRGGVLAVGSGNLTRSGIDSGNEVFCEFHSDDPDGLAAIVAWRDWMQRLIDLAGDEAVRGRWISALRSTPWLTSATSRPSSFLHNLDRPLLEQMLDGWDRCEQLHLTAPFVDRDARTIRALIDRLDPHVVHVYLGADPSVDGAKLASVLSSARSVRLWRYEPSGFTKVQTFVHAKLIAFTSEGAARLLSGSANLSAAALQSVPTRDHRANVEVGTIADGPADELLAAFQHPRLEHVEIQLADIEGLRVIDEDEPDEWAIHLLSAERDSDGVISVATAAPPLPTARLGSPTGSFALNASRTADVVDATVHMVWIESADGERWSNPVPVDDPAALAAALRERKRSASELDELDLSDIDTPVGRMLHELNRHYIFDVDQMASAASSRGYDPTSDAGDETQSDFWERLAQQELQADPRADAYRRFAAHEFADELDIFAQLRLMLDRTPDDRQGRSPGDADGVDPGEQLATREWIPERKLQVRLGNLLTRWIRKTADPRLRWLRPTAPARNFSALACALAETWERGFLPAHRNVELTGLLLRTFIGDSSTEGVLGTVSADERADLVTSVRDDVRTTVAALAFMVLREDNPVWRREIFDWQGLLQVGLDTQLIEPDGAAHVVQRIGGPHATDEQIGSRLRWATTYIDDPRWCHAMQERFTFPEVRIGQGDGNYPVQLSVEGVQHLLDDPRLVALVREAIAYRPAAGLRIIADGRDGSDLLRMTVKPSGPAFALDGERQYESSVPLTPDLLAELEHAGAGFRAVCREVT